MMKFKLSGCSYDLISIFTQHHCAQCNGSPHRHDWLHCNVTVW